MECVTESQELSIALRSEGPVLLLGPTGSGKSSLARWIHERGCRARAPYSVINLATLTEGTFESELFGHERGAFTGAGVRRMGRLESAQGGTVFLDEIGELTLAQQAKLLEFLQTGTVYAVGGNREIRLNVRVIVATHRDLAREVQEGRFRADLFHRLRLISIELPPLSALTEEFDAIVHRILDEVSHRIGKRVLGLSPLLAEAQEAYSWPGNFRELRHVLEYCVLAATEERLEFRDLPLWFRQRDFSVEAPGLGSLQIDLSLDYAKAFREFERVYFGHALRRFRGGVIETAREIGVSRSTLLRRLREYGLAA